MNDYLAIVPFDEKTMINRGKPTDPAPTWVVQRIYEFEDKTDFTVNMTEFDITVENGKIDMFGWIYENGEFIRQKVEFAAPNNGAVKIDGYSPEEVQHMIMINSSDDPEHRIATLENLRKMSRELLKRDTRIDGAHYTYAGMDETNPSNYIWGKNFVPVIDSNGSYIKNDTAEFLVVALGDRNKGLVCWYGEDDMPIVIAIESKYIDFPKYFNKYWETNDIND